MTYRSGAEKRFVSPGVSPSRLGDALRWMMAVAVCVVLSGCANTKSGSSTSSRLDQTHIDELNLLAMPVAINLDSVPGVDGFAIQVYAVDRSRPKTQPIRSGTLDILMCDGLLKEIIPDASQYRHVWSYTADQLKTYGADTTIGASYRFTLNWGADQPRDDKVTLIVRYRPSQGPAIYSAPSSISIPGK